MIIATSLPVQYLVSLWTSASIITGVVQSLKLIGGSSALVGFMISFDGLVNWLDMFATYFLDATK
jgi:hypothetical protein